MYQFKVFEILFPAIVQSRLVVYKLQLKICRLVKIKEYLQLLKVSHLPVTYFIFYVFIPHNSKF